MTGCFLSGFGDCRGKITGEHYISKNLLEALGEGKSISIGGLPWIPQGTLKSIGISSLVSNVLCEKHNSDLSYLDQEAGNFFRALDAADKNITLLPHVTKISGVLIERWLLKVLCGLVAPAKINHGIIPETWKSILNGKSWPPHWGVYVPIPSTVIVLAKEFYIETSVHPITNEVLAALFRIAGVQFMLVLGRPDHPASFGTLRPRGLIFRSLNKVEKRIDLQWPVNSKKAVIFTKIGTGNAVVPQWEGWKTT